jgi:hypothetical protein
MDDSILWIKNPFQDVIMIWEGDPLPCPDQISCGDFCLGLGYCKIRCEVYCSPFN